MTFRRTIAVLFAGCTVFSPGAHAFWFFQHRAAPVTRLSPSHHHRGYRHHRHYRPHPRRVRTYRRVITEYRIYYVPQPYPATPSQRARALAPGLKHGLPPSVAVPGTPGTQPAPMAAAAAPRPPAPAVAPQNAGAPAPLSAAPSSGPAAAVATAPASQPPAAGKRPAAHAAQVPGNLLAPVTLPAGTAATSANAHQAAPVNAHPVAPAGATMTDKHASQVASYTAARPQQLADRSPLAQTAPSGMPPQPARSADILHAPQASSPLTFLAPLVAALAALSGLVYAVFRKRKGSSPGAARQPGAVPPQPDPAAMPVAAGRAGTPPAAAPRRGFNFDEIRRVNVDRVFMSPFPPPSTGTDAAAAAAATNTGGDTGTAAHPSSSGPPANAGKVVQHAYGDVTQGIVDEIYDTPEAKARVEGFYAHIPAEFQALAWVKVTYDQGRIYTLAAAMPGMVIHPGDTVRLVFGQQEPPVPNQIVAVTQVRSAAPGTDAGIMAKPA